MLQAAGLLWRQLGSRRCILACPAAVLELGLVLGEGQGLLVLGEELGLGLGLGLSAAGHGEQHRPWQLWRQQLPEPNQALPLGHQRLCAKRRCDKQWRFISEVLQACMTQAYAHF